MSVYRSPPPQPADIVTYRHGNKLVYVKPAENYELALDIAQKEFEELSHVSRDCIGFAVMSTVGKGERCPIRISESAWPSAVTRLLRGEIIDVYIRLDPRSESKEFPPPQYLEVPKVTVSFPEKPSLSKSSGSSKSIGTGTRSTPSSRSNSPSHRTENRRSWFGSITR
ncbi:hypothetical protein D9611_004036 [Ephemerocybe angulata]|uniref:Uncharacterized protein n=1 Tax=Ephemerocybe angulata TaxID=980116 RepID=A0A8H5B5J8_9AGAR|nr:hypothetical protein D9611_004036 [Tulosesus angulatus]